MIFSGHTYTTGYSYLTGQSGLTTPLVSGISQSGESLAYTYDACGNILTATRAGQTPQYEYDALNRLTRSNDPWNKLGGTTGATMTYEYDLGGNVKKLKRHAYTTGTPSAAQQTVSLSYTNTGWKDLATTFNNQAIQNDAIGNTLQTSIWSYEWEHGRQLKQVSNSRDHQTTTFLYNEEGLRVRKTVVTAATATNPVSTTEVTDYTLHGKNVVHLTKGTDSLHFYYDVQNRPALVKWDNGTVVSTYAYIYDLQGDVIGLLDSTGAEVVRYAYNDYGLPAMRTGTLADTLGLLNPFRYRGYVYDDETQLYYLRSRYYNPYRGRFINTDIIMHGNLFSYCLLNPINATDYYGMISVHLTERSFSYLVGISDVDNQSIVLLYKEYTKKGTITPSNKNRHEKGRSRKKRDEGHEKGDDRRKDDRSNKRHRIHTILLGINYISFGFVSIIYIAGNDITGFGVADDGGLIPACYILREGFDMVFLPD